MHWICSAQTKQWLSKEVLNKHEQTTNTVTIREMNWTSQFRYIQNVVFYSWKNHETSKDFLDFQQSPCDEVMTHAKVVQKSPADAFDALVFAPKIGACCLRTWQVISKTANPPRMIRWLLKPKFVRTKKKCFKILDQLMINWWILVFFCDVKWFRWPLTGSLDPIL